MSHGTNLKSANQEDVRQAQALFPPPIAHTDYMRPLKPLALKQLANYHNGTGIILNLHIVHHGGTAFCNAIGRAGPAPKFACWKLSIDARRDPPPPHLLEAFPGNDPWRPQDTAKNIRKLRPHFHMISWEYGYPPPKKAVRFTDWEEPNLFSVLILRHPMDRLLAGDRIVNFIFPGLLQGNGTQEQWESYTRSKYTDNFALRVLTGNSCCQGADTPESFLDMAKELVQRFSVVIDIECLTESMLALADLLKIQTSGKLSQRKKKPSPRERIGRDDIYETFVERNTMDIRLYEWAKSITLLDCDRLNADKEKRTVVASAASGKDVPNRDPDDPKI